MNSIRRIERMNYGIGAILVAASALTQPQDIALGIAIGVLLTCINFFVLRKLVTKWTREAAAGQGGNASMLMLPKMLGLMGAVALAIVFLPINVVAFAIGYSVFLASIAVEAVYSVVRTPDDDAAGVPGSGSPTNGPAGPARKPSNSDEHTHG